MGIQTFHLYLENALGVSIDFLLTPCADVEQSKCNTSKSKKWIKNKLFLILCIIETLMIVALSSLLIFEYSHINKYENNPDIDNPDISNPYIRKVSLFLERSDNDSLVDYKIPSNKTYYCEFHVCGNASVADFSFSSSANGVQFYEIKHLYDEIFFSYIHVGDIEGRPEILSIIKRSFQKH